MRFRHAPVLLLVAALGCLAAFPHAAAAAAAAATPSVVATAAASATATAAASGDDTLTAAGRSIVAMTAAAERTGSGIVTAPGHVLTSTRVLMQNDPTVRIMTVDGSLHTFSIIARDNQLGLVLLAADIPGVQPMPGWGPSGTLIAGDPIFIFGLQSGDRTLLRLKGTVSSPSAATGGDLILTDIKLDPLVEGGALVTPNGMLVGIVTAKSKSPELGELGWAVTSDSAKRFVDSYVAQQKAAEGENLTREIRRWVVRAILALLLGVFVLFGWWFRRWYKRMEAREAARAAGEGYVAGS